jgi:hypothetical protein
LNIIEYLFCERFFGQVLLIEKSAVGKVQQEKCGKKSATEKSWWKNRDRKKCDRKIMAEKVQQRKCGRKIMAEKRKIAAKKVRQKNRSNNMVGVYL